MINHLFSNLHLDIKYVFEASRGQRHFGRNVQDYSHYISFYHVTPIIIIKIDIEKAYNDTKITNESYLPRKLLFLDE